MIPISFSSLTKLEQCPRLFKAVYIDKINDLGSAATFAGDAAHKALELAIKEGNPAPDPWTQQIVNALRAQGGTLSAEKWLTVNREWKYAGYGTPTYLRSIADVVHVNSDRTRVWIGDLKSGKWVPNSEGDVDYTQLRIAAMAALGVHRQAQRIDFAYLYSAKKKVFKQSMTRADFDNRVPVVQDLLVRFVKYEEAQQKQDWVATPCRSCNFCPVATCQHNPGYDQ